MTSQRVNPCASKRTITIHNVCSLPHGHKGEHSEESMSTPIDPMDDGVRWTRWPDEDSDPEERDRP